MGWHYRAVFEKKPRPVAEDSLKASPPPLSYETKPQIGSLGPNFLLKTLTTSYVVTTLLSVDETGLITEINDVYNEVGANN